MADFPTNIASNGSLFLLKNNISTLLTSTISAAQTDITLSSSSPFPPVGYITVETEAILYTANATATGVISGTTRGADSTTAAQHDAGLPAYHNYVANHHNAVKDEIIAIETAFIQKFGSAAASIVVPASVSSTFNGSLTINTTTAINGRATFNTNTAFSNGTTTAAGIHGLGDTDTGFNFPSAGSLQIIASGTSALFVSSAGEITQPLQPSFLARFGSGATDVTGDATVYTVAYDTEIFDQGSDYNTSTFTFTAPVTGRYLMTAGICALNVLVTHTSRFIQIITSNRTYHLLATYLLAETNWAKQISVVVDMDANDTATVGFRMDGSTKTVDVSSVVFSDFSGSLLN